MNNNQTQNLSPEITLSDRAVARMLTSLAQQPDHLGIKLSIKKTGCSGLAYVIDYVSVAPATDYSLSLNNTAFLCIDPESYRYITGLKIDYVKQGINHKFVFENPNQTGQCGCGESFTVE